MKDFKPVSDSHVGPPPFGALARAEATGGDDDPTLWQDSHWPDADGRHRGRDRDRDSSGSAEEGGAELGGTRGSAGSPASQQQLVGRLTVPAALAGGLQLQGTTRSVFGPGQLRRLNAIFAL